MPDDTKIKDLLTAILPPDNAPMPCPHCGRTPKLCETAQQSWFACRKWFSLRACTTGPRVFEGWEAGEWSRRSAAYAWNRMVMRARNRRIA